MPFACGSMETKATKWFKCQSSPSQQLVDGWVLKRSKMIKVLPNQQHLHWFTMFMPHRFSWFLNCLVLTFRFLYISYHFLTHFNPSILCASSSKRRWSLPGVCSPHCTGGRWQAKFQAKVRCLPAKSWAVTSAIKEQCARAITKGSHHIEAKF